MGALGQTLAKHREAIVAELRRSLAASAQPGAAGLEAAVDELFGALAARLQVREDPRLAEALQHLLRYGTLPPGVILGALLRLAAEMRSALLNESPNRRTAALASAAIDRVLAETVEQLAREEAPKSEASRSPRQPPAPRDPTILRDIREALAGPAGDDMVASVISLAVHTNASAKGATMVGTQQHCRDVAHAVMQRAGAALVTAGAPLLCAYLPARVGDGDAEEALALAIELGRQPELRACSIGVARARLCVSGEGEAFGEAILRATALAAQAEAGHVLCAAEVWERNKDLYVMRASKHALEGYLLNPEQPRWSERWEQAALVAQPELVGHAELLSQLVAHLADPTRQTQLITLRGRAGAGKHLLLETALARAGVAEERVLYGAPHALAAAPYWTLLRMLEPLEASEALLEHPIDLDDGDLARPRADLAANFAAALEKVAAESAQPLVLVVDDADRLDKPTAAVLGHALRAYRGPSRLSLVMLTRRPCNLIKTSAPRHEIFLPRLAASELATMTRAMLEQDELPPGVLALIEAHSEGLPAMAVNLVRFLVESGYLQRRHGLWDCAEPVTTQAAPRQLSELARRRVEQLPAGLLAVLKAAATLGDGASLAALELVVVNQGITHDELLRALSLLGELDFLRARRGAPAVRFSQTLFLQTAYELQTPDERRTNHRLAAAALEEHTPHALDNTPAVLFSHWGLAAETERARQVGVRAAEQALHLGDPKSAMAILAAALPLCAGEDAEAVTARFDLLIVRERLHDMRGRRAEQKDDLRQLAALGQQLGDPLRRGRALHRAARLNLLLGDAAKARGLARKAVETLRAADPLDLSNALRTLALVLWHERDLPGARAALDEALAIYGSLRHARGAGFVLHSLGLFALDSGLIDAAQRHLELALGVKRETQDKGGEAAVLEALGQVATCAGERDRAAAHLGAALELHTTAGDLLGAARAQLSLAECLLATEPARAGGLAKASLKTFAAEGRRRAETEARLLLGRSLLRLGKREAASRQVEGALAGADSLGGRLLGLRCRLAQAEVDLAYSSHERTLRAAGAAEGAAAMALAAGANRWRIEALSVLAEAQSKLGNDAMARAAAAEALSLLRERTPVGLDATAVRERCAAVLGSPPQTTLQ
jgi:tetratricopeptide (TPR) repeat protein